MTNPDVSTALRRLVSAAEDVLTEAENEHRGSPALKALRFAVLDVPEAVLDGQVCDAS